jgi:vanillate O-demethylase monooxygenase subunit
MFLTECWQVAAYSSEVTAQVLARRLVDVPVLLYRTRAGEVTALQDRCPHRYLPLSMGRKDGDVIECGYHGMRFGPDGQCQHIPGQAMVPGRANVRRFPTVERHTFVWIWMGDASKADPDLVPDFHWMDSPEWAVAHGYHFIHADYRLLVDNLLDLSHETFVHPETIGNSAVADSPVSVKIVNERTVCAHRDMLGAAPPPQFVALAGFDGPIDRWQSTYYTVPGFCVIDVGAVPAGTGDKARGFEGRVLNLITPATADSSHYFWGHARNIRIDDEALTQIIQHSVFETFNQDKVVLEAQQREAAQVGTIDPGVVLGIDAGPVQGRRILRAALKAQEALQAEPV